MVLPRPPKCHYCSTKLIVKCFAVLWRTLLIGAALSGARTTMLRAQLGTGGTALFAVAHVDSRAGASMMVAYTHEITGLLEWKANLQTGYQEGDGALGYRWSAHGQTLVAGMMVARDAEWVWGLAFWPSVSIPPFTAGGQILVLLPLRASSLPRYYTDPVRGFLRLMSCCQAGVYYRRDQAGRTSSSQALGPSFQFVRRGWRLVVDAPVVPSSGRAVRTTVATSW